MRPYLPILGLIVIALAVSLGSARGQGTFQGYPCTIDCSGHEAGYKWAQQHNITDPSECGGNSQSFIEGCRAAAGQEGPDNDELSSPPIDTPDNDDLSSPSMGSPDDSDHDSPDDDSPGA